MPKKKKPRHRNIGLLIEADLYEKAQRIAASEDRSVSAVVRRLIADAPEPEVRSS
jgi:predicted CopG family antitoxin